MGKYQVYGVGHALVDMEFAVTPEWLQQFQIDKGVMTLVDEARQAELLTQLNGTHRKRSCGGSAANTMVAFSQFGGQGFYSCKVACDETGDFYLEDLVRCGLASNLQNGDRSAGVTGKCLVMITPDADRTMNTFLGITATISETELDPAAIANSEYLYLEGYLVSSPSAQAAAVKAREVAQVAQVKTALSLSDPNMVTFFKLQLEAIIDSGLDLIFANEAEALKMAETDDFALAIDYFKTFAKQFAITRGPKGSLVFDGTTLSEIDPVPVNALDTVGAGDMYAGAFLYGLTHGMDMVQAGNLASRSAARLVTEYGPRLDTSVIQALLNEH